ncbi:hypothetical protein PFISCL1PPCAC_13757, partial [Pristionchus fissidentatus]
SSREENICEDCTLCWSVPKWGGTVKIGRVTYKVVNTCPLDSFLAIVISYYQSDPSLLRRIGRVSSYENSLRSLLLSENVNEAKEKMIVAHYDEYRFDKGSIKNKKKQMENHFDLMSSISNILKDLYASGSKVNVKYDCDL